MRWRCGLLALAVVCACDPTAALLARDPPGVGPVGRRDDLPAPSSPAAEAAAPADAAPPAENEGNLLGVEHLQHLFEVLANLDKEPPRDDVVILQYGDSHTAADVGVAAFRRALQGRFGDGGRGFVPLGRPWRGFSAQGLHASMEGAFVPEKPKPAEAPYHGLEGCSGLLGLGIESRRGDARALMDVTVPVSHIELSYALQPGGGSFDVYIDGPRASRVTTHATEIGTGFTSFDVADTRHRIEVRTIGNGDVVLYGATLGRPTAGVVVSGLGINGAQVFTQLHWGEACFADQLQHVSPDLVILAYGTNEALDAALTDSQYEQAMTDLLARVARAEPTASCLLLGPPDLARRATAKDEWKTWPRITEIIAAQKRVAHAAGCAFYDQMEAMGGAGSMAQWASETNPRAARDRVHLKKAGYEQLGTAFAKDLIRAYDRWRERKGMAPATLAPASP